MRSQKGLRMVAFILVFCMVFHSVTIYAADGSAELETLTETQTDTTTSDQDDSTLNTLAETDEQGQTAESDLTTTDTNEETSAAGETLPEGTDGSDEDVSGAPENETSEAATEETTGEPTETGEAVPEEEITMGETVPATEPLSENGDTESESDDIAMMMGLNEIDPMALDAGTVATFDDGRSFETLQQAIDAVTENEKITLLGDISGSYVSNGKSFTLDLDTHMLSASGGTALTVTGGNVTVQNGTIDGGGSVRALELQGGCTFTGTELTVCNGQVSGNGGGISATDNCTVTLTDCHILNNTVDGMNKGGGIYMKGGTLIISGTEIAENIAYEGAGIYLDSTSIQGEGLNIHENASNGQGGTGGVYLNSVSGSIRDSEVYENTMAHGSGFYISGGSFELDTVGIWGNTVYNLASGAGVALSCRSKAELIYKNGQIHDNNGKGQDAIIYAQDEDTKVRFENADIYDNTGVKNTAWFKNYANAVFEECSISGNTASEVGGVKVTGFNALASFQNTVIKDNTADSVIGGLYVGTRAGVEFIGDIAIYGNTTKTQNSENDIMIESNKPAINLPAASSMKDEDKSFDDYVWKEGNEKYSQPIQISADNNKERSFTAIEDKPRYVARIGEMKYEKLDKAVEDADESDTIFLIAGNDPEDPYGNALVSDPITISKSVTIHFSGQNISCTEESVGNKLFEVTEDGSLTLTGEGKISGEVESQGTLILEGKVSAEKYIHNGKKFTLNGPVGDITVELAKEKYLTATDKCEADSIKLIFDSDFVSDFNDETKDDTADRLLVEHDGSFKESKLVLQEIKPLISKLINEEQEVKLQKSLLKGVFVGGTGAADTNSGAATDQPVATLEEAVEKLNDSELDTIWVLGEVEVSEPTVVNFADSDEKKQIKRHPSYDGVLFRVESSLELSNVIVDGMRTYMEVPTDTLFEGDASSSISINSGAELCNNDLNKEETDVLTEADKKKGGAIRSNGTVVLDGGKIHNCNAYMGGGIYIHDGLFQMKSGTITDCTATGHMSYNGESQVAAGGGVCVEGVGKMTMEGGTIENCSAGIGGGISLGGSYVLYPNAKDVETFVMEGGTIQNCIARTNGGGLYVQGSYKATIGTTIGKSGKNYIYIQGNESRSGNFGGGGIYVNSGGSYGNGRLQLYNAVIRNNTAGSPGGGLAGCNTSRTEIYLNDGGVFYQNKGFGKKDDILLSDSNGATETSAPNSFVSEYMLGGAPYLWKHVGSDEDYGVNYLHDDDLVKHMYTNAADGSESINNALALATVFIQNNSSVVRGGGIGSNGDVILGTAPTDTVDILVKKVWDDEGYGVPRPAQVAVWLLRKNEKVDSYEKVGCVEIDSDDNIDNEWPEVSFTRQPRTDSAGNEYKYTISEEVQRAGQSAAGRNIYTSTVDPKDANRTEYIVKNRINCGRLYIEKTANGVPTGLEEKFKIKVELTDDEGEAVPGPYMVRIGDAASEKTPVKYEFTDGTDIITLMDGQYAYIDDIPENTNYKVTEQDTEGYIVYAGDTENPGTEQLSLSGEIEAKQTESAYFKNVYSHDNKITVTKLVINNEGNGYPLKRTFWVALFEDEDLTKRATEPKELVFDGTSSASVTFDGLLNNKTYYVGELDSKGNVINAGNLSDGSSFTVEFDGEEQNSVTARHDQEVEISFKNVITPKIVKSYLEIPIAKELTGREPIANKDVYTFTLEGLDGAPMPAKSSATLTILPGAATSTLTFGDAFGAITFPQAETSKTYKYVIRERAGEIGGITYDEKTVYRVTIQVDPFNTIDNETVWISNVKAIELSKDGGTTFKSLEEGVDGTAAFKNVYHADPVPFKAYVKKTITGDVPADNPKNFTFQIEPDSSYAGLTMPDPVTVTVNGQNTKSFGEITFTEAGTYKFRISEVAGSDAGYTYSDEWWTLTVVVKDNLNGNLEIEDSYYSWEDTDRHSTENAEFTNHYTTTPYEGFKLKVTKSIDGEKTPTNQTFDFNVELKDGDPEGVLLKNKTASITGSGETDLGDITFSKAGTYTFQVYEVPKSIPGYSFDGNIFDVEVVVTDEESQLEVSKVTYKKNDESPDGITFTNTYSTTSVSYAPQIRKVITGDIPPVNKDFHFEITNMNSAGVTMPASRTAAVSGSGRASFDAITFTKAGTYTFEIQEVEGSEHGYTYSSEVYTLTVEVTDENSVLKLHDIKYQAEGSEDISEECAEFKNAYAVASTSYAPSVIKKISGEEPPADKTFEFKIAGKEGDPEGYTITNDTVKIKGQGRNDFEPITFSKAGTYSFEISETAGEENGYTYDTEACTLEVKVIDEDSYLKVAEANYYKGADRNAAEFENSYAVKSTEFEIPVKKVLTGSETPDAREFSFKLTGQAVPGYEISSGSLKLTGAGEGAFGPITFTKAGTYTFTVSETRGSDKGYTYDDMVYTATITVTDYDSQLKVDSVDYEADGEEADAVVFTNHYTTTPVDFKLEVTKEIDGEETPADQTFDFNVELKDKDQKGVTFENKTASITGSGRAAFGDITFSKAGTYTFQVYEVEKNIPGYIFDENNFDVEVLVTDEGSQLTVKSVTYKKNGKLEDEITFTNTYSTTSVSYAPQIRKTITGDNPPVNKDFHFEITNMNSAGVTMPASGTVTVSGAGSAKFDAITFTKAGTYKFKIQEVEGSEHGYTYSSEVYTLTVVVTDENSELQLHDIKYQAEGSEDDSEDISEEYAEFENSYAVKSTEFEIPVKKVLTGSETPDAREFSFKLTGEAVSGCEISDGSLKLAGAGKGAFAPITFTKAGTYTFTVSETKGSDKGYTYDDTVYTATITVGDHDSQLMVDSVDYEANGEEADAVVFTNHYTTAPVDFKLEVTKEIDSEETPAAQTFDFSVELKDKNQEGVILKNTTASITGSGETALGDITFSKAGTYTFQVYEVSKSIPGYSFDGNNFDVEVVVTDEEGQLTVSKVTYKKNGKPEDGITFTNRYNTTSVSYAPQIRKVITGDIPPVNKDFHFEIRNRNSAGVTMPASGTAAVSGAGRANFEAITFTKAGTYTFEIREVKDAEHGYTYSNKVYTLTVEVTDENSVLKLHDIKYQAEGSEDISEELAEFTNVYAEVPTSYGPLVIKEIDGEEPPVDKTFEFKIAGKEGNPEGYTIADDTVTIKGHGHVNFEPITFSKAGTYSFEISETAGSDKGYVYDDMVYTVVITVGDHDSQLQVDSVVYEADGEESEAAVFTNRYEETYVAYQPKVRKVITGEEPQTEQKFEFTLTAKDTDGLVMPESTMATVSGQGTAMFDAITFMKAGVYSFEIREVNGGAPGYTYSEAVWTLTVQVTDEDSVLTLHEITYQSGEEQRTDAAEFVNEHRKGSLVVQKELVFKDHLLHALDQKFYVALYSDAECTNRVSDVRELVFEDETSEEVVFDGLDIGTVYYVGECSEDGTALSSGYLADGTYFQAVFADGNEVLLEEDKEQVQKNFSNEFLHIPQHYYYQGELTVEKRLQDAEGNPKASNDIFYIGVFEDEAHTKLSDAVDPNILTLDMAGHSVATATVYTRAPDEDGLKLYLAEVDANGVLVQGTKEFAYNVAMSTDAPMLTLENDHETVAVTNQEKYEETEIESEIVSEIESETESETEQSETEQAETEQPTEQTKTGGETNAQGWSETEPVRAVGTGDETNVRFYIILLALSAGMTAAVLARKREKRKKG